MPELVYLQADRLELRGDDDDARLAGRIVPFDEPRDVGGLTETWDSTSFAPVEPDNVALRNEHRDLIGRGVSFETRSDGAYMEFRLGSTAAAAEVRTLAAEGILRHLSVGFFPNADLDIRSGRNVTRRGADLREVSTVAIPAFENAQVLAVRNERGNMPDPETAVPVDGSTEPEVVPTPDLTAFEDRVRALEVRAAETPEYVETKGRFEYRSAGEVLVDMNLHARGKSPDATVRLQKTIDDGIVSADGAVLNLETRDNFPTPGNSVGAGVPDNLYVPDLLTLLREGRPTADLFEARPLPREGNTIQTPRISQGSTVDYQDNEGTQVSNQNVEAVLDDWLKSTLAGGQGMTIQAVQWGNPSYADMVVSDLLADFTEQLDNNVINGDPAVDTPLSGTGFTGILNAGATDVPVGGDMLAAIALVGTAWAAVYQGSRRSPIAAVMNSVEWGSGLDLVDSDGRPIISNEAPQNPAGFGNAASVNGTFRGLPVVLDENVPAGNIIIGSFRDAVLWSDPQNPAQIALTFPSVLVTDVTVYGFHALAIRRPLAFAVLSGIV